MDYKIQHIKLKLNDISRPSLLKRGSQLNFGEIGVELRMKERTIEEGIHVNHTVSPLIGLDFQGKLLRKTRRSTVIPS